MNAVNTFLERQYGNCKNCYKYCINCLKLVSKIITLFQHRTKIFSLTTYTNLHKFDKIIKFYCFIFFIDNGQNIDNILHRLCVHERDSWNGIAPSIDSVDFNPEPPIFTAKFANAKNYKHILAIANEDGKVHFNFV